jgi:hypothetical protein
VSRFRRIIWNALTVLSAILCLATIALWIRSYKKADFIFKVTKSDWTHYTSALGRIELYWKTSNDSVFGPQKLVYAVHAPYPLELDPTLDIAPYRPIDSAIEVRSYAQWNINGNGLLIKGNDFIRLRVLIVPHWVLVILFAFLPTLRIALAMRKRMIQRRRSSLGLCRLCGYDLRASCGRCPECGAATTLIP